MRNLLIVGLLVLGTGTLGALRLEPLPEVAARAASGPALDVPGLQELALVLSGVSSGSVPAYSAVLDRWSAEFTAKAPDDPVKRGEALLQFLHTKLKSYVETQTRVDVLIDRGTFNCVSSAVVYMILGRKAGLDVQAVATSDHAFALVRWNHREIDVETTTPYGFDPGTKTEFTDSFGRTGFAYVAPGLYAQRRSIGDRQLLGLLVQNRLAEFERTRQSELAVGPALDRWVMEATPEARQSLVQSIANYGAWLNGRREYQKGLDLAEKTLAWTNQSPEVHAMVAALLNNQVNVLLDRRDHAGAQALTVTWKNRGYLTEIQAAQITQIVAKDQLNASIETLPPGPATELVDQAFRQGLITASERRDLLTVAYTRQLRTLAQTKSFREAVLYLDSLPAEVRAIPSLVKAREQLAYNWTVEIHNRFVELWNSGRRDEARGVLREALAQMPEAALLKKDLVLSQAP